MLFLHVGITITISNNRTQWSQGNGWKGRSGVDGRPVVRFFQLCSMVDDSVEAAVTFFHLLSFPSFSSFFSTLFCSLSFVDLFSGSLEKKNQQNQQKKNQDCELCVRCFRRCILYFFLFLFLRYRNRSTLSLSFAENHDENNDE